MGGTINVESSEKGTIINFTLIPFEISFKQLECSLDYLIEEANSTNDKVHKILNLQTF